MTDDALKRAHRALQPVAPRQMQPAGPQLDRGEDPLARARALIAAPTRTFAAPPPVREPGPELVRLPMTCGARGGSYVVIAERRGNLLRFVGHEMPRTRQDGEYRPGLLSGEYQIEFKQGWGCPLCQNDDAWLCSCADFSGALHCAGSSGGRRHCVCGRFEERNLVKVDKVQVRGASVAATPGKARPLQRGQPQLKQVSYERNR